VSKEEDMTLIGSDEAISPLFLFVSRAAAMGGSARISAETLDFRRSR